MKIPKSLDRQYSVKLTCKKDHMTNDKNANDFLANWKERSSTEKEGHIVGSPDFFYYLFQLTNTCDDNTDQSPTVFSFCSSYTKVWHESIQICKQFEKNDMWLINQLNPPLKLLFNTFKEKLTPAIEKVQEIPSYQKSKAYGFFKYIENYKASIKGR